MLAACGLPDRTTPGGMGVVRVGRGHLGGARPWETQAGGGKMYDWAYSSVSIGGAWAGEG